MCLQIAHMPYVRQSLIYFDSIDQNQNHAYLSFVFDNKCHPLRRTALIAFLSQISKFT